MLSHTPSFKDSPWRWHHIKTIFRPTQGAPIATRFTSPKKGRAHLCGVETKQQLLFPWNLSNRHLHQSSGYNLQYKDLPVLFLCNKNLTYHTIHSKRKWCTSGPVGKSRLSCYGTSHNQWTHEPAPSHVSNVTFSASVSTGGGTIFGCTAGTVRGGPSGASVGVAGGVLWGVWGPPRCGPSITRAASPAHRDGGDVPTM